MTRQEIKDKVFAILMDHLEPNARIEEDLTMLDLGYDSIDMVEIALALEDEFDVEIPDEELSELETPGHIINKIESKLS